MFCVLRIASAANIILADFNLAVSTPTAKLPNLNPRQIFRLYGILEGGVPVHLCTRGSGGLPTCLVADRVWDEEGGV